jgi:hypothetical protein
MKCFRVEGHHDLTPLRTSILFTWMLLTHFGGRRRRLKSNILPRAGCECLFHPVIIKSDPVLFLLTCGSNNPFLSPSFLGSKPHSTTQYFTSKV